LRQPAAFLDTNILLYLLSADAGKADRAEALIAEGPHVSVQVLNEFAAVSTRKLGLDWREVRDVLTTVRRVCTVEPLTVETHDRALHIAERYRLRVYDALIIAAALLAGCKQLYSEDLQHGKRIDKKLLIVNPF
jgi:predicted nucleic acid-binding protein